VSMAKPDIHDAIAQSPVNSHSHQALAIVDRWLGMTFRDQHLWWQRDATDDERDVVRAWCEDALAGVLAGVRAARESSVGSCQLAVASCQNDDERAGNWQLTSGNSEEASRVA